jgi:glycosidase
VADQIDKVQSPLNTIRKLHELRAKHAPLKYGSLRLIEETTQNLLVYERIYREECIRIYVNLSDQWAKIDIDDPLIFNSGEYDPTNGLGPDSGMIVKIN